VLTPKQIGQSGERMERLCASYEAQVERRLPEFLAFLSKPDLTRRDKDKAVAEFNAYISKLVSSLRKKSNRLLEQTLKETVKTSLRSDRQLVDEAAEAGADMEGQNG